jgi:hypothetical protein
MNASQRICLAALVPTLVGLGCGTRLHVRSIPIPAFSCTAGESDRPGDECEKLHALYDAPGGIVVNQRARYSVCVESAEGVTLVPVYAKSLDGIDQAHLLAVDYRRQPFADAKLAVTLDRNQAVKSVGIQGEPGSTPLVQSVGEAAAARREIREAQEEVDAEADE